MSHGQRVNIIFAILLLTLLPLVGVHAQSDTPAGSVAVVRGQGALLLDDTGQQTKATLTAGMLVMLIGRSADSGLLYVESGANGDGWVMAGSLLTASVADLPVRALAAAATAIPAPTGAITPSATLPAETTPGDTGGLLPTPTPAPAALTAPADIVARVALTDSRLNLRAGPGTVYPVVTQAQPDSLWHVVGRTAANDWLQVTDTAGTGPVWADAAFLTDISGALTAVPVNTAFPALPTPTATTVALLNQTGSSAASVAGPVPTTQPPTVGATGLSGTLVFQDRVGGTIYSYDLGTDTLRSLTSGIDPAISNDGRMVAFSRDGGAGGLYVINLDGSGERLLYNERDIIRSPKWSPDDQWIVFSSSSGYEDCRMLEGGVCLPDEAIWDTLPEEFQNGNALNALRGLTNQREYFFSLARIGVDGEGYRDVPTLNKAQAPDWNEAGITYFSSMAGIQITADDGDARTVEVANDALLGYFEDPDWQPNGGRIVFQRQMNGQHWQIFVVNPDGTGLAALTHPVTALVDELPSSVSPAWSPDGQHIVYLSNRSSIESAGAWHIWVMNADGSDQRMLPVDVPMEFTYAAEQMVSWGPSL